ncbi:isatin hydrolase-like isoform X1 [Haliotis cracherodii]|uniref:isatin hydrolase-like isoform X1 n=2 Tax=Haliotis cracherodii TaxID=6455 RepID=UPI0039E88008
MRSIQMLKGIAVIISKMKHGSFVVCIGVLLPSISGNMKVVDLTWPHKKGMAHWPGEGIPEFKLNIISRGFLSKLWFEINWFVTPEHAGTHFDAPAHFFKGKWRAHEIPAERLIGPAVVIDVTSQAEVDHDYRVTKSDFERYEREHGRIPHGAIVIMNSGWGSRFHDKHLVFNSEKPDTPSTYHFPGYHEDAISWLLTNRNVSIVGVDTPSVDYGQSTTFKVHVLVGENGIIGLENVANIEKIPVAGATIFVGAMKLFDGSGGPARIIATFDPLVSREYRTTWIVVVVTSILFGVYGIYSTCFRTLITRASHSE